MANVSLEASLRTCKVNGNDAVYAQSERIFNPNAMVCPFQRQHDQFGRESCLPALYSKSAGCNSASDRISVENKHRPDIDYYIKNFPRPNIGGTSLNNTDEPDQCRFPYHY